MDAATLGCSRCNTREKLRAWYSNLTFFVKRSYAADFVISQSRRNGSARISASEFAGTIRPRYRGLNISSPRRILRPDREQHLARRARPKIHCCSPYTPDVESHQRKNTQESDGHSRMLMQAAPVVHRSLREASPFTARGSFACATVRFSLLPRLSP